MESMDELRKIGEEETESWGCRGWWQLALSGGLMIHWSLGKEDRRDYRQGRHFSTDCEFIVDVAFVFLQAVYLT